MSPAWRGARAVLRLLRGLTILLLLLCPQAVRSDCIPPPDVPNATPALEGRTSFPEKSIVTYKCNKDFVKIPGKQDAVICLTGNKWSPIAEFCNRSCDVPTRLLFAVLKQPYNRLSYFPEGCVVEYECRLGYTRNHSLSGKATCLQNFTWSKPDEFCNKKSCRNPGEIINGYINITTDILFGASIIFSCNTGYKLIGPSSSYCIVVGDTVDWSDPLPECKESSQTSKVTPTPQKPTTVNIPGTEAPSAPQTPIIVNASATKAMPTPQKPTTVNIPATEASSISQTPIIVNASATKAMPTPQKPTTVNIPATEASSISQKPIIVNAPATKAIPTPQKPTTVNIPATEASSISQKPIIVNAPATKAIPTPQKPTTVYIPATEASSISQTPIIVNAPATKAMPTPQKPTRVNIPATEAPSAPQTPIIVNAPATKAPLIPQKPITVNVAAKEASSTPQKTITANDSATIAKTSPISHVLSTETPPASQTPIIANTSATQVTVTQKFTTVHDSVIKRPHTTQTVPSAHITATQSQAVTRGTTTFRPETLSVGVSTIASGLVAGTIIIGTLILVRIFWDYGKSGSYYTREDNKAQNAMFHNLTVTPDASEVRLGKL
ncbi:complement decay-accelerating factor isoform X2 [Rhinolophus ferrumequinum]|uniref:complement decay-accelerating factor isoform X2 n=1 Tax=Rhinolophus ferrumequinum TaxID=59479 RepID=UPI00140FDA2F|nr:complement decay-accelerating factor isoform X2 [Rhinolophus ferrumequinum]